MNMKRLADAIYNKTCGPAEKIRLLHELILDCQIEMNAQSENMHPEIKHNLAEGLRVATDYVRQLEERHSP